VTLVVSNCEQLPELASYCETRYGQQGTAWEQKPRSSGRKSIPLLAPSKDPACNIAYRIVAGRHTEVMVNLYNELGGLIGQMTVPVAEDETSGLPSIFSWGKDVAVSPSGQCTVKLMKGNALNQVGIKAEQTCLPKSPIAPQRSVKVEDITGDGPLILGTHPLPENLQGLWWLTNQGNGLALLSFGGPSDDGGCCSTGFMIGPNSEYKIRVHGDRTAAFAHLPELTDVQRKLDPEYMFEFYQFNGANPISARGSHMTPQGLSQYQVTYLPKTDPLFPVEYPTSKVWIVGNDGSKLVQVIDGKGRRLEPAWTLFDEGMKASTAGNSPGWLFYSSVEPSPSVGYEATLMQARGSSSSSSLGDTSSGEWFLSSSGESSGGTFNVWGFLCLLCCCLLPLGMLCGLVFHV